MPTQTRDVSPHYKPRSVRTESGDTLVAPDDWALLPPGDAGLTRRVKAAGPSWTVKQKKGRKVFSHGVWALEATIEAERAKLEKERETPEYKRKRAADAKRREEKQAAYVLEFHAAVVAFLAFHPNHEDFAARIATAVTDHAVPVGSGTVARTQRIPIEKRAESAVIAWMRHQTTAYDHMKIARVKGKRREVRARLAKESRRVLAAYRSPDPAGEDCPLAAALSL